MMATLTGTPYCTAVALADGQVTLAQFDPKRFTDPALLDLVAKVHVHRDAVLNERYPQGIPNRVTVTLADEETKDLLSCTIRAAARSAAPHVA